jgi:hypothetical protein
MIRFRHSLSLFGLLAVTAVTGCSTFDNLFQNHPLGRSTSGLRDHRLFRLLGRDSGGCVGTGVPVTGGAVVPYSSTVPVGSAPIGNVSNGGCIGGGGYVSSGGYYGGGSVSHGPILGTPALVGDYHGGYNGYGSPTVPLYNGYQSDPIGGPVYNGTLSGSVVNPAPVPLAHQPSPFQAPPSDLPIPRGPVPAQPLAKPSPYSPPPSKPN